MRWLRHGGWMAAIAIVSGAGGILLAYFQEMGSPTLRASTPAPPSTTRFLVVGGGGAPSYNEIALEKNVLYFQRTLNALGLGNAPSRIFFANGNNNQATVRYLDPQGREQFKAPEIPNLDGPATLQNVRQWVQSLPGVVGNTPCSAFFYFTGHGALNRRDANNNALILWGEDHLSVRSLATWLDAWPTDVPFVTMMAQCYSGSFANLIYEGGDPNNPIAMQPRCGFFATVKTRPSVGCTPLVNEADYADYSSSFFAGLSGRDRLGNPVPSADYDENGTVSFAEAHAFAKIDKVTPDWPISTAEAWLQDQATPSDRQRILATPINTWLQQARPDQQAVITALSEKLGFRLDQAFQNNRPATASGRSHGQAAPAEVQDAYRMRLQMELMNVGMEQQIRQGADSEAIAALDKLLACEASRW
ncbi:MAG: Caspase domain-containing protein [Leptolyngbyaceae cyanobacterium T60_A2020_046]|nr:Caspase domain-containing protein [Leptolyngbyaceae cyanobacterium T60_A2020_046]